MANKPLGNAFGLFAFSVCILMVASLMLPRIVWHRQTARAVSSSDNMRQIGIAIHNYHSAYKQLPPGTGGTTGNPAVEKCNAGRLGPLVAITPFLEEQRLWEMITNPFVNPESGQNFPPMGPVPWYSAKKYHPWGMSPSIYQGPHVSAATKQATEPRVRYTLERNFNEGTTTSYVACYGDGTFMQAEQGRTDNEAIGRRRASNRGMFVPGSETKFRDVLDGLSNTIMFAEVVASRPRKAGISEVVRDVVGLSKNPSLCLNAGKADDAKFWVFGRGALWADGFLPISGFQTVLPPNSPSCTSDLGIEDPVVSASSLHPNGVYVLMADGAVRFATDSIDTGDLTKPGVSDQPGYARPGSKSPYGVWGSLGSRASAEVIPAGGGLASPPQISPRGASTNPSKLSLWRDKEGVHSLRASFVKIIDKKTIQLEASDGTIHEVPLNSLQDQHIYRAVQMDLNRKSAKD